MLGVERSERRRMGTRCRGNKGGEGSIIDMWTVVGLCVEEHVRLVGLWVWCQWAMVGAYVEEHYRLVEWNVCRGTLGGWGHGSVEISD